MQTTLIVAGWLTVVILGVFVFSLKKNIRILREIIKTKDGYIKSLVKEINARIQRIHSLKNSLDQMRGYEVR